MRKSLLYLRGGEGFGAGRRPRHFLNKPASIDAADGLEQRIKAFEKSKQRKCVITAEEVAEVSLYVKKKKKS